MDLITDEFILARTGETLETRLKNNGSFRQQMQSLHEAAKEFTRDSVKSEECWKAFVRLEEEWSKYNSQYGEESYRLGFEDGVMLYHYIIRAFKMQRSKHALSFTDTKSVQNGASGILSISAF